MANQEIKIKVAVDAQTGQLKIVSKNIDEIGTSVDNASKKTNGLRQGIEDLANTGHALNFLKSAFFAAKNGAMALLDTAGEFEKYKAILTTLEGSSQKANESFGWVKEFAKKTPYELSEVTQAFVKLRSYGINPTDGTLKTLGDTSAGMGKKLEDAVEMMADAMTGENERLKEFGIKASTQGDYIKYTWSNSSGEAKETIVKNNSEIIKSTLSAIFNDKYQGAMDNLSQTWEGLTSNLKDNWTQFKADVAVNSGFFDGAKEAVRTFNKEFSTITNNAEYMEVLGTSIKWGAVGIIEAVQSVSRIFLGWAMIWKVLETNYGQLKINLSIMTDEISLKITEAQKKMDEFNPFSSKTQQAWDAALKTQREKITEQIAASALLEEEHNKYIKNLDSSNKIYDNLQDAFLKIEKEKQAEIQKTAETSQNTTAIIVGKTQEQIEAEKKAKAESKKLAEEHAKWIVELSEKTLKAQVNDIEKPYMELDLQYKKDLEKYGKFTGSKAKLDEWYSFELNKLNDQTAKKIEEQNKKESEALEKKQKEENANLIASSKQRQTYYEKMEDYVSAWAELERVLRLDDTKLTKQQLETKIAYEKKAYLESKGIYEDLYSAISSNLEKSTKDWSNYNLIVGKGFGSMVTGLQSTMQSSLVDVFEGKIKSIGAFFDTLWGSIKKSFFNMVAEMATKTIIMNFMNSWKSGGNTGKGFVETFLGIDIPFLNFAEGTIWGSGKYGIAGGGYNAIDSYANDKIPAMISKGEAVIPASAVNKNKSVVSALIAGSRLDNRGLLDVSYVRQLAMYAEGYDPSNMPMFDKAAIDSQTGLPMFKGGGFFGDLTGTIIDIFTGPITGGVLTDKLFGDKEYNRTLGGAMLGWAGSTDTLKKIDPGFVEVEEAVMKVMQGVMKYPWLGWLVQAAIALYAPALIPAMLQADAISAGMTMANGGSFGDALAGAGLSGALAGGVASFNIASAQQAILKNTTLTPEKMTTWEVLKNYPDYVINSATSSWDTFTGALDQITSPNAILPKDYLAANSSYSTYLESGSPMTYDAWKTAQLSNLYNNTTSTQFYELTQFSDGSGFLDYPSAYAKDAWGFNSYDLIGEPATQSMFDVSKEKLIEGLTNLKSWGATKFDYLSEYLRNPSKIFQYVLKNIGDILSNIQTSVESVAGSPLLVSLLSHFGKEKILGQDKDRKSIHAFAEGGIVTGPTLGLVGEAGYAEAVIPLHRLGEVTGMEEMQSELQEIKAILREVLRADKTTSMWTERFAVEGIKVRA